MESDIIWFNDFYNKISVNVFSVNELTILLGDIERTNNYNEIRNNFLTPINSKFSSICVTENIKQNIVTSIIFIGTSFSLPYNEINKNSLSVKKQFNIYDDKVEYVFSLFSNPAKLKSIICKTDESALTLSEEKEKDLIFNNIIFHF